MPVDAEVRLVIEETSARAAEKAIEGFLTKIGVDVEDPIEMQKDFQWARDTRMAAKEVKSKGFLTLVGILVSGAAAWLWSMINTKAG